MSTSAMSWRSPDMSSLLGAIAAGVAGTAMFNLAPLFLAAAADRFLLDDAQIGQLVSVEVAGIALASFAGLILVPRFGCRKIALIGLVMIVSGNLLATQVPDYSTLLVLRFAIGLGGDGLAYVAAIMALGMRQDPTRGFALLSFSNMCFAGGSLALLPQIHGGTGWTSITVLIAATALAGLFFARGLPVNAGRHDDAAPTWFQVRPSSVFALVGILVFTVNLGAVWSYAERIGSAAGLSIEQLGVYLGVSMAFQGIGSLTAAGISTICERRLVLGAVLALQLIALYTLADASTGAAFLFAVSLWGFSWNIGIANLLGMFSQMPAGRRLLALAPGTEAIGASVGPSIAAALIAPQVYTPVMVIGAVAATLSISIFLALEIWQQYRVGAGK